MQKLVKIAGTLERYVAEKFSMIYLETDVPIPVKKRDPRPVWHLEDETIPTLALCGFGLLGTCKSVSPALAMWGKPCEACQEIVAQWLFSPVEERTQERRLYALYGTDTNFRGSVKKSLPPELFLQNYVEVKHEEVAAPVARKRAGSRTTAQVKARS